MEHVATMDRNEAYKRMCLAQDEIERLQSEIEQDVSSQERDSQEGTPDHEMTEALVATEAITEKGAETMKLGEDIQGNASKTVSSNAAKESLSKKGMPINPTKECIMNASGPWLHHGGKCSIEYLPNIKCYSITLSTNAEGGGDSNMTIPSSVESLQCTVAPHVAANGGESLSSLQRSEVRLNRLQGPSNGNEEQATLDLLLSVILLTNSIHGEVAAMNPSARISVDSNSISIRVQLQHGINATISDDLVDILLAGESSYFSPLTDTTTDVLDLNYLCCRTCQNPIIEPPPFSDAKNSLDNKDGNRSDSPLATVIKSVLPLPSGYWDDISDYLICYEGQASVDFTSSSTNAIPRTALEDDVVFVLHKDDLMEGGVCALGVGGYGEHSLQHRDDGAGDGYDDNTVSTSQVWKDKSIVRGERPDSITCSNCCSALGFVSSQSSNTFRLYKHLLDCGRNSETAMEGSTPSSSFSKKYTCGSFLAKEMVRYAESEAIYTFIVGISDEHDWTRLGDSGPIILLRLLSWDTPMAIVDDSIGKHSNEGSTSLLHSTHFRKVAKVIFEERTNHNNLDVTPSMDDPMEWTWGNIDLCCPPPQPRHSKSKSKSDPTPNKHDTSSVSSSTSIPFQQRKASSTKIFFSKREWSELREDLICSSQYFSESIKDALVMTKLGLLPNSKEKHSASLSFLPIGFQNM